MTYILVVSCSTSITVCIHVCNVCLHLYTKDVQLNRLRKRVPHCCHQPAMYTCCLAQVRGYLPLDPKAARAPQLVAASQALKLQELASRKQELLFELQGYSVNRAAGQPVFKDSLKSTPQSCMHVPMTFDSSLGFGLLGAQALLLLFGCHLCSLLMLCIHATTSLESMQLVISVASTVTQGLVLGS